MDRKVDGLNNSSIYIFISAVYAELKYKSTGTAKVQLEGQINDGKNYATGNTVVDFKITGRKCRKTRYNYLSLQISQSSQFIK